MQVLIIEDEIYTAKSLVRMIKQVEPDAEIVAIIESIEDSVQFLANNAAPDLIFMDIQLSDGLSFEIFKEIEVNSPVIFTTSYDEYAIKAFEVNSIDYLLKPIEPQMLERSLSKFHKLNKTESELNLKKLFDQIKIQIKEYKSRFLVKTPNAYITVQADEIAYFYIENQLVFLKTVGNKHHIIEKTLDELEKLLDPKYFFRLNRQIIARVEAIKKIHTHFNGALKVELDPQIDREIIVSRYTVKEFKEWLDN